MSENAPGAPPGDAFVSAVESVRPAGSASPDELPGAGASAPEPTPAAKKRSHVATGNPRGRPPGSGKGKSSSSSSSSSRSSSSASSAPVQDPPVEIKPVVGAQLENIWRDIVNPTLVKLGATPFSAQEIKAGGEALAPVVNHYAKAKAEAVSVWGGLIFFGLTAGAPRIVEVALVAWQRIKAKREAEKLAAITSGGEPGLASAPERGAAPFSPSSAPAPGVPSLVVVAP